MKQAGSTKKFARLATVAVLSGTMVSAWAWEIGRFTGGGSIYCPAPIYRVTFGYELHCQPDGAPSVPTPNNLQINFSGGDNFHLTFLREAECGGPGTSRPTTNFNTIRGIGDGTFNGSPASIEFTLIDAAEPGRGQDSASFVINQGGTTILNCTQYLEGGNNQAHRATGRLAR
jgi:hypothetical protein